MGKSTCIWPDCDRPEKTRGMCQRDYMRAHRVGEYETPWIAWAERLAPKRCPWPECDRTIGRIAKFCKMHYQRARLVGDMDAPWLRWESGGECTVCGRWAGGTRRGQLRYCSRACNMIGWKLENPERVRELAREHTRRRRAQILTTQVEKFTDDDIRMRHGDICYLCGELINFKLRFPHPQSPSVDHVVPLSRGGAHTLENVAMTHYVCNQKKSAKDASVTPQQTLLSI